MKIYPAKPLVEHLAELKGKDSTEKVKRLVDIYSVYSLPCTKLNLKKCFSSFSEQLFENLECELTIDEFITISLYFEQETLWREEIWIDYLFHR